MLNHASEQVSRPSHIPVHSIVESTYIVLGAELARERSREDDTALAGGGVEVGGARLAARRGETYITVDISKRRSKLTIGQESTHWSSEQPFLKMPPKGRGRTRTGVVRVVGKVVQEESDAFHAVFRLWPKIPAVRHMTPRFA